ncbi:MAG TPA: hypothetical protein VKX28_30710 [Xanthobacteraceae bacterium]|nr:hypothetical protein [Xanthobacteraceae bacterium]
MRRAIARFAFAFLFIAMVVPAAAAPLKAGQFASREAVLGWMNNYRNHRDPAHVPDAVHAMSQLGIFRDAENAGAFIGFIAGALHDNPAHADAMLDRMLPLAPEDQWALVQAIAYSEMPGWKNLLYRYAGRLPARRLMSEKYLLGELPTLDEAGFEEKPGAFAKIGGYLGFGHDDKKKPALLPTPALLDVLWGFYCATGAFNPAISDIVAMLSWAKERDDVDKLTLGGMAKYTLAANASRDAKLLTMLKSIAKYYPKDTKRELDEVTLAAETMDLAKLRKDALASIDELKRKGPGSKRDISLWGQIGEGALALGCIGAAAVGQVEFGIPCVVGGAVSSAGLHYWDTQN